MLNSTRRQEAQACLICTLSQRFSWVSIHETDKNWRIGCGQTDEEITKDHPCHPKNIALQATHAGRVKTDVPIYGVLTQPFTNEPEKADDNGEFAFINDT